MALNSGRYLITCYHVIENLSNNIIKIKIWNKNTFNLRLNNNSNKIYKVLDVVLIDIKEYHIGEIDYLYYDTNYIYGFKLYENIDIFTLSYQFRDELVPTSGRLKKKIEDYKFSHTVDIKGGGSSGCPIISFTKKVIGIHQGYRIDIESKAGIGIFIGKIVDVLNKNIKNENSLEYKYN